MSWPTRSGRHLLFSRPSDRRATEARLVVRLAASLSVSAENARPDENHLIVDLKEAGVGI